MEKLVILGFLFCFGLAIVNLSRDYLKAEDKRKWIRGAVWWLVMYMLLTGPLFLTLLLLMTFGQ